MYLLIILALIHLIKGQVYQLSNCTNIPAVKNMRPEDFAGRWYGTAHYQDTFLTGIKCIAVDYKFNKEDGNLYGTVTALNKTNNSPLKFQDELSFTSGIGHGYLKVMEKGYVVQYQIEFIDVDYNNYAIAWGCKQHSGYSSITSWVMVREPRLSPENRQTILRIYKEHGMKTEYLSFLDRNNCTD